MRFLLLLLKIFLYLLPYIILFLIIREIYFHVKSRLIEKLAYTREFSEDGVFEEDEVEIIESITNPTLFPLFCVDVESYIHSSLRLEGRDLHEGMQPVISRFHLPPYTKLTRRYTVKCAHRGYFTMNTATVLTKSITVEKVRHLRLSEACRAFRYHLSREYVLRRKRYTPSRDGRPVFRSGNQRLRFGRLL